jgi:hypothetical protein
MTWISDM